MAVLAHLNQPSSNCRLRDAFYRAQKQAQHHCPLPSRPPFRPQPHAGTASTVPDWNQSRAEVNDSMDVDLGSTDTPNPNPVSDNDPRRFASDHNQPYQEMYSGAARTWPGGQTFMDRFDEDQFASMRKDCPYYPFSTKEEWELAAFLICSDLSMVDIDQFLKLPSVSLGLMIDYDTNLDS